MRRLLALAKKELWEHGAIVLALLFLLCGIGGLLLVAALVAPRTMSLLETHASFTRFFLPIVALALGNRLVVREYQRGTQRFLEALPVMRVEIVLTKLGLGFLVLSLAAMSSLAPSVLAAALRGEPLTVRWLALVFLKTELFVLALWTVLFTLGLVGRWRVPVYLGVLFALLFVDRATDAELGRFGPFALVGERFVLERYSLGLAESLGTLAVAALAIAIALGIALSREGGIAEALARRMTQREKVGVGAVLVFAMMASEIADARKDKDPFTFDRPEVARRADPAVEVLYLEERNRAHAEALADVLAADLASLREALAIEPPRVHVALRETLDPHEAEVAALEDQDGVLVRAAFTDERFDQDGLRTSVLVHVLDRVTDGRASFEPYAWVCAGLARAWVHRDTDDRQVRSRALFVARSRAPSVAMLERWQTTDERFGHAATEALAYAAMVALRDAAGSERWLAFARSIVGREPPPGLAAVIDARLDPLAARMEREAGVSPAELERALGDRVAAWRRDTPAMRAVPRARATVEAERGEGELRAIRWRLELDRPAEPGSTCALVHAAVGPFDAPVPREELLREERACDALDPRGEVLLGRYGPGERVLAAVEMHVPSLGAPVRVAAARLEVPR